MRRSASWCPRTTNNAVDMRALLDALIDADSFFEVHAAGRRS